MKNIIKVTAVAGLLAVGLGQTALASTISQFSDWGINSSTLLSNLSDVQQVTEDQHDNYLNPGYGGQNYDVEGIYSTRDANYLYIGVMTGRAQNASGWTAGDIALDFGSDGSYEYGMVTSSATGTGSAAGVNAADVQGIGSPGQFYDVTTWNYGIWEGPNNTGTSGAYYEAHPVSVNSGNLKGTDGNFKYDNIGTGYGNWGSDTHYFITAAIDLDWLDPAAFLADELTIHWAATCNNDWLELEVPGVDAPTTLPLLSLGLLALFGLRRKYS